MSYDESRRFERTEFRLLPWVFTLTLDAPFAGDRPLRVEARNIGIGGMKFVSNQRIPIFSAVEVSFFENQTGKELAKVTGKVIRVEEVDTGLGEKTFGMALEFAESSPLRSLLAGVPTTHSSQE
ncbi:MAG: PilZ domain-containing protein [Bacteriovoracia bacterium]